MSPNTSRIKMSRVTVYSLVCENRQYCWRVIPGCQCMLKVNISKGAL